MRDPEARLRDVLDAVAAVEAHLAAGSLADGLVFDAVRMRLIEVGEAVKALPADLLAREPEIEWRGAAAMRDLLAHRYFDTLFPVVEQTVRVDLPSLRDAVRRLLGQV